MKKLVLISLFILSTIALYAERHMVYVEDLWYLIDTEKQIAIIMKEPENVVVTQDEGSGRKLIIPDTIHCSEFFEDEEADFVVVGIGESAFRDNTKLEKIVLPPHLLFIDNSAFLNCTKLKSITLPDGLIEIGYVAFAGCSSLQTITIPATVNSISDYAFANCKKLRKVEFLNSMGARAHKETWFTGTKASVGFILAPGESVENVY